ncbi:MAG: heavy-metal-associated domain-containing protein [Acidobacteriaceae bacterium]|nr:heavy-metal-associated domain-containing protein [Acidobacteriaceae bacterium]
MFEYIHNIQGRLRLRTSSLKANAAVARELQIGLGKISGVRSVQINLLTGSVLILHDGKKATINAIAAHLEPLARMALSESLSRPVNGSLTRKAGRFAVSVLVETILEKLLMSSMALL